MHTYKELLSVPERTLIEKLGKPELSWNYRGMRQLIYSDGGQKDPVSFTITDGIVSKIDAFSERRRADRIKPIGIATAHIQFNGEVISADIENISTTGVACRIPNDIKPLVKGTDVRVCMVLSPRGGGVKLHLSLLGKVARANNNIMAIIYSQQPYTHSLRAVESFVNRELALDRMETDISFAPAIRRERSDRCLACKNVFCGIPAVQ